jgi:hypothetical protein
MIRGQVVRREAADTVIGRTLGRLRNLGILANASSPASISGDLPELHPDVVYSLMLDDEDTEAHDPTP